MHPSDTRAYNPSRRAVGHTKEPRVKRWVGLVVALAALGGALWAVRSCSTGRVSRSQAAPRAARVVSVVAGTAARRDVAVTVEGLGTVVAYRTVTVRPQVDGRLDRVSFVEGQVVKRGQVLAQIDPRPFLIQLHQAEGALARDRAQLANAQLTVRRDRTLVAKKLIAPQQLDTDLTTVGQLEGTLRIDEATVAAARLNLDYARITSPVDGVTGVRLVDAGNLVRAADSTGIVIVTQLDPIAVLFTLPQDELPRISGEMRPEGKRLRVEALSRDGEALLGAGELQLIDNQINQSTATLRLKAVLPNPQRRLWPNQFVKARLHLATRRAALVVPATTLQNGPSGTFVYVIKPDLTVEPRPVQAEPPRGEMAIIVSGLSEGERVVVDGQSQLRPGGRVAPREPGQKKKEARRAAEGG
jgi:membrane fusion protein, multidrug efflux system